MKVYASILVTSPNDVQLIVYKTFPPVSSSIDRRAFGKTVSQVVKIYSLLLALFIDVAVILAIISQNTDSPKFIVITFETRGNTHAHTHTDSSFLLPDGESRVKGTIIILR